MATFDKFIRNLRRGIGKSFSKRKMRQLGKIAIERIQKRTRRGYGVARTGQNQRRLKPLSDSYIDHRRRNRRRLDKTTSPRKSNLTFTGRLLRSMVIKQVSNRKVTWGPKANRRAGDGGLTNEELGIIVTEMGRPFNNLSKQDIKAIKREMDKALRMSIRKL